MNSHHQSQMIEALEARRLLSAELLQSGELVIIGTSGADAIMVEPGAIDGQAVLFGVPGVDDGTAFDGVRSLTISTLAGRDFVDVRAGLRDSQGMSIPATIFGGRARDRLLGGDGDDVIRGGGGPDLLRGRAGDDILNGNAGNDTLRGDTFTGITGNDRLVGGGGDDDLFGERGDDRLIGNAGDDRLFGGPGNDRLLGNAGDDRLFGEEDNDRLIGGAGADLLDGGLGDDVIEGGAGDDQLVGGDGNDLLKGRNGNDVLSGDDGNDELRGNAGFDNLRGGPGIDILLGGDGSDVLAGGEDNDLVTGGRGVDTFRTPFSERQDFNANDRFFTDEAGRGEQFALLSDEVWERIDDLDRFGVISDVMWLGIDGAQELLAESGIHEAAFNDLKADLSDAELAQLDAQLFTIVIGFLFDIGSDFEALSSERIFELFDDLQALNLNTPMQDALDSFVMGWRENQAAADNLVRAMVAFGDRGVLQPILGDALGGMLLNLWPI